MIKYIPRISHLCSQRRKQLYVYLSYMWGSLLIATAGMWMERQTSELWGRCSNVLRQSCLLAIFLQPKPCQPHSKPPNWGVHAVTGGQKFQSRHHLAPHRKLWSLKLKYAALEISELRGPFERKVNYSFVGPFDSKVFACYNCCKGASLKAK